MNNTSLSRLTATAGTCVGQDIYIKYSHDHYSIQNFNLELPAFIPSNRWFSPQAIDQYSSLLYYNVLDLSQFQCGRSTSQTRLRVIKLVEQLPQLLLARRYKQNLKAVIRNKCYLSYNLFFYYKVFSSPHFKVAPIIITHLYTTFSYY